VKVIFIDIDRETLQQTLLDSELVDEKGKMNLLIFDIACFEELDFIHHSWGQKMDYVERRAVGFRDKFKKEDPKKFSDDIMDVSMKHQWILNEINSLVIFMDREVKHDTDEIIFTPLTMEYIFGTCSEILKWKPIELNSVDFLSLNIDGKILLTVSHPAICENPKTRKSTDIVISALDGDTKEIERFDGKVIECIWDYESQA
jgi:hypothetical protein